MDWQLRSDRLRLKIAAYDLQILARIRMRIQLTSTAPSAKSIKSCRSPARASTFGPCNNESPHANVDLNAGASTNLRISHDFIATSNKRNFAIATANGLMSTPWILFNARWVSSRMFVPVSFRCQRLSNRGKAPSRKCPIHTRDQSS